MKKIGTLNQPLSAVIAGLGHTDTLVIADAGLPIPPGTVRIDLALTAGVPGFLQTLQVVLEEMEVESAILANEMETSNPHILAGSLDLLGEIPVERISHAEFKRRTESARAVVRTGECTPYANVILVAGVIF